MSFSHHPASEAVPSLPSDALVTPRMAEGASLWLEGYIEWSRRWSPCGYEAFHAACGIFALSTVAARRVAYDLGKRHYTSLLMALVGPTSLYAKTTTAELAPALVRRAGLGWLLHGGDATAQKFVADLVASLPDNYGRMDSLKQEDVRLRAAFAAQRGWHYEEFGSKIQAMMNPQGFMADFRRILRRFDDTPETYTYSTLGRGTDEVERPYLPLLATMTFSDMRRAAKRGEALWGDGFFARFAFVAPPKEAKEPEQDELPDGDITFPSELVRALVDWHSRLGVPQITARSFFDKKQGQEVETWEPEIGPTSVAVCSFGADIKERFYRYYRALKRMCQQGVPDDLAGNYVRLAEKAFRVAALLASLENDGTIEMRHWARAQLLTEEWRASLHHLYDQVNAPLPSDAAALEEDLEMRVRQIFANTGKPVTSNDIRRYKKNVPVGEIEHRLDGLASAGVLCKAQTHKNTSAYYPSEGME